jgi:hypothetical protein
MARWVDGWVQSQAPGSHLVRPLRAADRIPMTRRSFPSSETTIVVSTDGYFDVYPPVPRSDGDKPVYRGRLNELGAGIRGADDRLAVRPTSVALADAVAMWSAVNGAAAVRGTMGAGRDGNEAEA